MDYNIVFSYHIPLPFLELYDFLYIKGIVVKIFIFFHLVFQVPYDTMTPLQAALGVRQVCYLFIIMI